MGHKKFNYIFNLSLFIIFSFHTLLYSENSNLIKNNKIIGTFQDMEKISDGIISEKNYGYATPAQNKFIIIIMGTAKYIGKIKLYWIKNYAPAKYKIEYSKNLFNWNEIGTYSTYNKKINSKKNNIIISTITTKNGIAMFFLRIIILSSEKEIRLSEIKIFPPSKLSFSIKNVKIKNIGEKSATIYFETDIPTTAYVRIGESKGSMIQNEGIEFDVSKKHNISVQNLLKGTEYYVQPIATALNGKIVVGKIYKFKTKGIPLPRFQYLTIYNIKNNSCKIKWKFNVKCKSKVYIGERLSNLKLCYTSPEYVKEKKINLKGLLPLTKYIIKIEAIDKLNNKVEKITTFTTEEKNIALNKKAYGTFYYSLKNQRNMNFLNLNKITDGNMNTEGIAVSGNINKEQIAIVDLGEKTSIDKIIVIWRTIAFPQKFNVACGNNLKEKFTIIKKNIDTLQSGKQILSERDHGLILKAVTINVKGDKYRFIKIIVPAGTKVKSTLPFPPGNQLQLAEIKVYKIIDKDSFNLSVAEIK